MTMNRPRFFLTGLILALKKHGETAVFRGGFTSRTRREDFFAVFKSRMFDDYAILSIQNYPLVI